jgi:hypothetical protein
MNLERMLTVTATICLVVLMIGIAVLAAYGVLVVIGVVSHG